VSARLHRFWFKFKAHANSPLGYGVTTWTEDDARLILARDVFRGRPMPDAAVTAEVDVRTLDPGHIRPNTGNPAIRGIWYPLGFAQLN